MREILQGSQTVVIHTDGIETQRAARQFEAKAGYLNALVVANDFQAQFVEPERGRLLLETEALDGGIDGVVAEGLQGDVGDEIAEIDVLGIEASGCFGFGKHMIGKLSTTDEERVDAQVEMFLLGHRILGSKSVDEELEIGGRFRCLLFKIDVETEQLDVVDGHLALEKGNQVELGGQACGFEHFLAGTVVECEVVDHNAVQKADVDTADAETGAQKRFKLVGDKCCELVLDIRNVQYQCEADIHTDDDTDRPADYLLQSSDRPLIFLFSQQNYEIIRYPYYFYHYFCSA